MSQICILYPGYDGFVVSPEFPVFKIDQERVLPETLDVYFRIPSVWPTLSTASTGTNVRRKRLNPTDFLKLDFPLPPMEKQLQLRATKARVGAVKRLQAETQAELDALLPSILDKAFRGGWCKLGAQSTCAVRHNFRTNIKSALILEKILKGIQNIHRNFSIIAGILLRLYGSASKKAAGYHGSLDKIQRVRGLGGREERLDTGDSD